MFKIQNGMRACAGDMEEITTSPEKDRRCTATRSAAPETKLDALARRNEGETADRRHGGADAMQKSAEARLVRDAK